MLNQSEAQSIYERIDELVAYYGAPEVGAAHLLCDRHAADSVAYRVISQDLSAVNVTYGDLKEKSERFAAALSDIGVIPGDRVATLMGKSQEYLVALLAIWRLGAVHVPLFTAFAPSAAAFRLFGSKAKVVVCDETQQPKLKPGPDIPADAPWKIVTTADAGKALPGALLFGDLLSSKSPGFEAARLGGDAPLIHVYTSGTTGQPKAVVVPFKAIAGFQAYAEFGLDLRPGDTYWCAADPGWAYGLYFGVLASFATGVTSILLKGGFDAQSTFAVISRYGVTNFAAAPTVYRALRTADVALPGDLKLRSASSAGEPLTPEVNEWAKEAIGVTVHDHYGQTEAGMLINNHHNPLLAMPIKPGSMGIPMPGWHAVILDQSCDEPVQEGETGRIAIEIPKSPFAWFSGYIGDAEKSAEKFAGGGRWYLTGDVGYRDSDGYFFFSSRDDDVIIMAGYRISPFEVESVLVSHPAVAECAAVAAPDAIRGEVLEAYVVLKRGTAPSPGLKSDLQQWVKDRFAAHAYPRRVHFLESLPKTPSGKIQRFVLRQKRHGDSTGEV